MAIPNRQIGWSQESNLLWEITRQMDKLTKVVSATSTYKVYTALLTQSGGSNPIIINDESLVIGVTYNIYDTDGDTVDFTNVGAPNNDLGTNFVATGTTPTSWGTNTLGQLQYNTGAPITIVLENTIGDIWFGFNIDGDYRVSSNALFTLDKTFIIIGSAAEGALNGAYVTAIPLTDSIIAISSIITSTLTAVNDELVNTSFEIRVYN